MRLPLVLLLAAVTAGCDKGPAKRGGTVDAVQVATWMPDSTCDFVRVRAHPDPDSLITEFLARDAAGQFLGSDPWFDGAAECPGHEPGPDQYAVIADYDARPLARGPDTLAMAVTSRRLGRIAPGTAEGERFSADTATVVDTVRAVRTPYGWRIAAPATRQFVLEAAARRRGDLPRQRARSVRQ